MYHRIPALDWYKAMYADRAETGMTAGQFKLAEMGLHEGEAVGMAALGIDAIPGESAASGALNVNKGTTTLYRAVSPEELSDIQSSGQFINRGSALGKYFSTSAEGASSYAKQAVNAFGDQPYTLTSTEISSSSINPTMQADVDGGIHSVVVPNDGLSKLTPRIHGWMPLP